MEKSKKEEMKGMEEMEKIFRKCQTDFYPKKSTKDSSVLTEKTEVINEIGIKEDFAQKIISGLKTANISSSNKESLGVEAICLLPVNKAASHFYNESKFFILKQFFTKDKTAKNTIYSPFIPWEEDLVPKKFHYDYKGIYEYTPAALRIPEEIIEKHLEFLQTIGFEITEDNHKGIKIENDGGDIYSFVKDGESYVVKRDSEELKVLGIKKRDKTGVQLVIADLDPHALIFNKVSPHTPGLAEWDNRDLNFKGDILPKIPGFFKSNQENWVKAVANRDMGRISLREAATLICINYGLTGEDLKGTAETPFLPMPHGCTAAYNPAHLKTNEFPAILDDTSIGILTSNDKYLFIRGKSYVLAFYDLMDINEKCQINPIWSEQINKIKSSDPSYIYTKGSLFNIIEDIFPGLKKNK